MPAPRGVVVVGSVNGDYVLRVAHRPGPGETVGDAVLELHPGGKGANQAVAAARSGAATELIARVGEDPLGTARIGELAAEGVGTRYVVPTPAVQTGAAFITVTPDGQNAIAVAPGANSRLSPSDIEGAAQALAGAAVLLAQLEVPVAAVARAIDLKGRATKAVLNFAPSRALPEGLLSRVDVLVANELEAQYLSGLPAASVAGAFAAARRVASFGPAVVVVTLGPLGAAVVGPAGELHVPAPKVVPVDTTGAGDAFVGVFAARLAAGSELEEAVRSGVAAGSATTEVMGALPVVPREPLSGGR